MLYLGLVVHWKQSTFCVLDGNGRHLRTHAVRGTWDKVLRELAKVKRPFAICFPSTSAEHPSVALVFRLAAGFGRTCSMCCGIR